MTTAAKDAVPATRITETTTTITLTAPTHLKCRGEAVKKKKRNTDMKSHYCCDVQWVMTQIAVTAILTTWTVSHLSALWITSLTVFWTLCNVKTTIIFLPLIRISEICHTSITCFISPQYCSSVNAELKIPNFSEENPHRVSNHYTHKPGISRILSLVIIQVDNSSEDDSICVWKFGNKIRAIKRAMAMIWGDVM